MQSMLWSLMILWKRAIDLLQFWKTLWQLLFLNPWVPRSPRPIADSHALHGRNLFHAIFRHLFQLLFQSGLPKQLLEFMHTRQVYSIMYNPVATVWLQLLHNSPLVRYHSLVNCSGSMVHLSCMPKLYCPSPFKHACSTTSLPPLTPLIQLTFT